MSPHHKTGFLETPVHNAVAANGRHCTTVHRNPFADLGGFVEDVDVETGFHHRELSFALQYLTTKR